MSKHRNNLPQLAGGLFLTDGGIETTLIFHDKCDLPYFAAFHLLRSDEGTRILRKYFRTYAKVAQERGVGFILESATWRASADWGAKLGYSPEALASLNRSAIQLLDEVRAEFENAQSPMVISGCVGPRGDGYDSATIMSVDEATRYHSRQIMTFRDTEADMVTAITMTNVEEAIGVVRAARAADMPVVISFTVETNGNLPTGQLLEDAVGHVDDVTQRGPAYYMINCAHPTHFEGVLSPGAPWLDRIRGIRANASTKSHSELDEAEDLDDGNPEELGRQCSELRSTLTELNVLGGCCGTDHRHVEEICSACLSVAS